MTSDGDGPRRRDVLRIGAGAGVAGFAGLSAADAFAGRRTEVTQSQPTNYAFSDSLQADDRFRVLFRPEDSAEGSTTRTVPADCLDGEPREYRILVVRAFRGRIQLGIRGLLVPDGEEPTQTTGERETATGTQETETQATTENETTPGNATVTEAALQNATTTPDDETVTSDGTATPGNETGTDDETAENETATTDGAQTTATPTDGAALPDVQVGEWYRVASSAECDGLFRLTLEAIDRPETTPADRR